MPWTITGTIVDPDGTPSNGAVIAIVSPTPARSTSGKLIDNDRVAIPVSGGQVGDVALESVPGASWTFLLPRGRRVEIADPGDGAVVNLAADLPAGRPLTPDEASLLRAEITRIQAEGLKGDKGDKGDVGPVGPPGPASKLKVGTVTTGAPGSQAAASLTGAAPNQVLDLTIPQGPKGDTVPAGPVDPQGSAGQPTAFELRGTGSPYGTVTPPAVGTYYTDTAGTMGAWRWIATGTTSASWVVQHGDTGWRDISSLLINEWVASTTYGAPCLRRIGSIIYTRGGIKNGTSPQALKPIPAGFGTTGFLIVPTFTTDAGFRNLNISSSAVIDAVPGSGENLLGGSWPAGGSWPSTLPGSPA